MHHSLHDISTNFIPDARLKCLTIGILGFCLIIGLLIPNIELVLGLVGSTTGSVICLIFPSIMFIRVTSKKTTERLLAQVKFVINNNIDNCIIYLLAISKLIAGFVFYWSCHYDSFNLRYTVCRRKSSISGAYPRNRPTIGNSQHIEEVRGEEE